MEKSFRGAFGTLSTLEGLYKEFSDFYTDPIEDETLFEYPILQNLYTTAITQKTSEEIIKFAKPKKKHLVKNLTRKEVSTLFSIILREVDSVILKHVATVKSVKLELLLSRLKQNITDRNMALTKGSDCRGAFMPILERSWQSLQTSIQNSRNVSNDWYKNRKLYISVGWEPQVREEGNN